MKHASPSNIVDHPVRSDATSDLRSTVRPDWTFRFLVTALLVVAAWLLAMPWVPRIALCTMQRFHLRTDSYVVWALQQPIPPMYSFANTTEIHTERPTCEASTHDAIAGRTINHFPTREFTFANTRVRHLLGDTTRWFVLRSAYRGQEIKSVYRLDPSRGGGWTATLEEDQS